MNKVKVRQHLKIIRKKKYFKKLGPSGHVCKADCVSRNADIFLCFLCSFARFITVNKLHSAILRRFSLSSQLGKEHRFTLRSRRSRACPRLVPRHMVAEICLAPERPAMGSPPSSLCYPSHIRVSRHIRAAWCRAGQPYPGLFPSRSPTPIL